MASDREKLEGATLEQLADCMQDGPQIGRPYHASAAELERRQSDLAAKGEAGHRRCGGCGHRDRRAHEKKCPLHALVGRSSGTRIGVESRRFFCRVALSRCSLNFVNATKQQGFHIERYALLAFQDRHCENRKSGIASAAHDHRPAQNRRLQAQGVRRLRHARESEMPAPGNGHV
jgi:hypothetical protein